jgi:hypothetical protein
MSQILLAVSHLCHPLACLKPKIHASAGICSALAFDDDDVAAGE